MGEQHGSFEAAGATIAWHRLGGSGEPLILINGYAATEADWDPSFLQALAAFCDPICIDNRGMGASTPGPGPATIELMAADVATVLDELGLERAPVLGWSMGGMIAQQLAADRGGLVSALVLLSTDHGGPDAVRAETEVWARLTDHEGTPREQASRLIGLLFPDPPASAIDEQFGELVAKARAQLDPEALSAQERAMADWHEAPAAARIAAIHCPVLCAAGTEDVVIPAVNSELLAAALANARAELFAGGGHAFMAQEPERLAVLIGEFLRD